jgi:hypothetical protein
VKNILELASEFLTNVDDLESKDGLCGSEVGFDIGTGGILLFLKETDPWPRFRGDPISNRISR